MQKARDAIIPALCIMLAVFAFLPPAADADSGTQAGKASGREEAIKNNGLSSLRIQEVFGELKKPFYLVRRDQTIKALHAAFGHRKNQAIDAALKILNEPMEETIGGERVNRNRDFSVAKLVIEAFPAEALTRVISFYQKGDGIARGNTIRAAGGVLKGPSFDALLRLALDDKAMAEEEGAREQSAEPLRVCDLAYNRIIFNRSFMNALRVISPAHSITSRDYHIGILKSQLISGND